MYIHKHTEKIHGQLGPGGSHKYTCTLNSDIHVHSIHGYPDTYTLNSDKHVHSIHGYPDTCIFHGWLGGTHCCTSTCTCIYKQQGITTFVAQAAQISKAPARVYSPYIT